MKQILNVSKRTLYISNIELKYLDTHIYDENMMIEPDKKKIKSYKNLGFVKVFDVPSPFINTQPAIEADPNVSLEDIVSSKSDGVLEKKDKKTTKKSENKKEE